MDREGGTERPGMIGKLIYAAIVVITLLIVIAAVRSCNARTAPARGSAGPLQQGSTSQVPPLKTDGPH